MNNWIEIQSIMININKILWFGIIYDENNKVIKFIDLNYNATNFTFDSQEQAQTEYERIKKILLNNKD